MMKNPKLLSSTFHFIHSQVEYDIVFYPLKDKKYFTVEIKDKSMDVIIKNSVEVTQVNKTTALLLLSNTLNLSIHKKQSGLKKDILTNFKNTNSICPTAVEKAHISLQNDITAILARYSKKWAHLKRWEPNYVHNGKDQFDMDGDEYTAIIAAGIYKNAPFADRIEFLAKFLDRTIEQIKTLLFYHFTRYNAFMEDDFYQEIFVEFETHISLYFTKFYKPDYIYGH